MVDYRKLRFEEARKPIDLMVDSVGGEVLKRRQTGRTIATFLQHSSDELRQQTEERSISMDLFSISSTAPSEEWWGVGVLVRKGAVNTTVSNRYELLAVSSAPRENEQGHVREKNIAKNLLKRSLILRL